MRETGFSPERHAILKDRYRTLAPPERRLLQFVAVLTEPVPRELLLSGGERIFPELSGDERAALLEKLLSLELLEIPEPFESSWGVPREIREFATQRALEEKSYAALRDAAEELVPLQKFSPYIGYPREEGWKLFRSLRRSLYSGEWQNLEEDLVTYEKIFASPPPPGLSKDPLLDICSSPFDGFWLCHHLPLHLIFRVLSRKERDFYLRQDLSSEEPLWETLQKILIQLPKTPEESRTPWHAPFFRMCHSHALFSGKSEMLREIPLPKGWIAEAYRASESLFSGEITQGLPLWEEALRKLGHQNRKPLFPFPYASLYVLHLLLGEDPQLWEKARKHLKHWSSLGEEPLEDRDILLRLLAFRRGFQREAEGLERLFPPSRLRGKHPFTQMLFFLALFWIAPEALPHRSEELAELHHRLRKGSLRRLEVECAGLLHTAEPRGYQEMAREGEAFLASIQQPPLRKLLILKREWQRLLEALELLGTPEGRVTERPQKPERARRLTWRISFEYENPSCCEVKRITPWIQKEISPEKWSKGAQVTLEKLREEEERCSFLTIQDHKVLQALEAMEALHNSRHRGIRGEASFLEALEALAGHEEISLEGLLSFHHLQIQREELQLRIRQGREGFSLELFPFPCGKEAERGYLLRQKSWDLLVLFPLSSHVQKILKILESSPVLQIPREGREDLLRTLKALSGKISMESEIEGDLPGEDESPQEGEYRPCLRLIPQKEGLSCEIRVYPCAEGRGYHPGEGGRLLMFSRGGKTRQISRDLKKEEDAARGVLACCTALERGYQRSSWSWDLPAPQDCLELLLQARECPKLLRVEWPKGESLKVTRPLSFGDLSVKISSKEQWFSLSGELTLEENRVLDLKELLEKIGTYPGQFIPLKNGEFLALTREFRRSLEDLQTFGIPRGKDLLLPLPATPPLHSLFAQIPEKEIPREWRERAERFEALSQLTPQIPSSFQGKLRDYQEEGFRWLVRMASLEMGACLGDDMGLGKTIQALAALLYLAGKGPSLVLAPTSVCMNWLREARRFTPALTMNYLGEGDREELLAAPAPYHVILCSYGLLQMEVDALEKISWNCIVLDEGQAIKNPRTKRWKNVMRLQGQFRLITSGTPLENHLGELWSLFRFLNPGLLGSLKSFNSRFASPIESEGDPHAAKRLKRLLEPFLLRRTKSQVLEELPPKTEILLSLELSQEENNLYEALRRKALEEATASSLSPGQKRIQILTHIMKLRRACCHPRLVLPQSGSGSSKLKALEKILLDLEENQHRALVFSQFVDHLSLVRAFLDRIGIAYQYLDGSTPLKERKKRVDAFQQGETPCFLISLKAGGMGLNLTAADYVIHLDPWWNPAVEDQASDRAHRIGQTRPVTIYRMVAKGTIEEKIVALHEHKRHLAEDILKGREQIPEVSLEDLMGLLRKE